MRKFLEVEYRPQAPAYTHHARARIDEIEYRELAQLNIEDVRSRLLATPDLSADAAEIKKLLGVLAASEKGLAREGEVGRRKTHGNSPRDHERKWRALTEEEHALVAARAEFFHLSTSDYTRRMLYGIPLWLRENHMSRSKAAAVATSALKVAEQGWEVIS